MSSKRTSQIAMAAILVAGSGTSLSAAETPAPKPAPAPAATHGLPTPELPGAPAAPAGPAGKAEMPETSFDAGTVERGADVSHAFVIKNVGEHPLTVDAKPG